MMKLLIGVILEKQDSSFKDVLVWEIKQEIKKNWYIMKLNLVTRKLLNKNFLKIRK